MNESQGPGGRETQHRPGVLHRHSQPAAHICCTLGQLTFFWGGGGGCIVLLCCVLLLLFLPVVYCFLYLYDSFLLMFLFIFGMYVLFSCIILLLEFNVNNSLLHNRHFGSLQYFTQALTTGVATGLLSVSVPHILGQHTLAHVPTRASTHWYMYLPGPAHTGTCTYQGQDTLVHVHVPTRGITGSAASCSNPPPQW